MCSSQSNKKKRGRRTDTKDMTLTDEVILPSVFDHKTASIVRRTCNVTTKMPWIVRRILDLVVGFQKIEYVHCNWNCQYSNIKLLCVKENQHKIGNFISSGHCLPHLYVLFSAVHIILRRFFSKAIQDQNCDSDIIFGAFQFISDGNRMCKNASNTHSLPPRLVQSLYCDKVFETQQA